MDNDVGRLIAWTVEGDMAENFDQMPDASQADTGSRTKKIICALTGRELSRRRAVIVDSLRPTLLDRMREDYPNLSDDSYVDQAEVERYRTLYVEEMLKLERGELSDLDQQVADSMAHHETVVENIEDEFDEHRTFGERVSDQLASFGGSWAFLISFFLVLVIWMGVNLLMGESNAFDPYPFILLNLVLSCIAAVQAPIIMMSQKRQEAKDRLRALNDYKVNLKAELEVRHVQEKLDYLLTKQWQRLAEMQQMQMELMQENVLRLRAAARRAKSTKKANKMRTVSLPIGQGAEGAMLSRDKFVKTVAKAVIKTARKKAARSQTAVELPLGAPVSGSVSVAESAPAVTKIKRKRVKPSAEPAVVTERGGNKEVSEA